MVDVGDAGKVADLVGRKVGEGRQALLSLRDGLRARRSVRGLRRRGDNAKAQEDEGDDVGVGKRDEGGSQRKVAVGVKEDEEEEEGGSDDAPVGSGRLRLAWEWKMRGTWHRRVRQRVAGSRRERLDLGVEARRTRATKGRGAVVATALKVLVPCVRCE